MSRLEPVQLIGEKRNQQNCHFVYDYYAYDVLTILIHSPKFTKVIIYLYSTIKIMKISYISGK